MNRHQRRKAKAQGIDIGNTNVKYDGRTLDFKVLINTDEPIEEVLIRIKEAAQGPRLCMVMVAGGVLEPQDAVKVWDALVPVMEEEAKKGGEA